MNSIVTGMKSRIDRKKSGTHHIVSRSSKLVGCKKCSNYPPSNLWNFIDYPPSKSERKIAATTPLEFMELHRLPPSKSERKIDRANYPPSNLWNFIDYPPLEIGTKNRANYPPSNLWNFIDRLPPPRFKILAIDRYDNFLFHALKLSVTYKLSRPL